ncbi:hypothetical protein IIK_00419 [Bacillus cereus VD102]|uniref:restriction endonuclease subunit S n=1 Tax=Bacillus cereus group sp. Bc015 TaxID=3018123 RepID=UPI00027A2B44|nr:restriction endonuclease subunit S [Bacillus cereus group sp. Bc015]EJR51877.1 hypothetical protein IIK_00419 [Bacillus cereus VD102]MDA2734491.1 restriction endonuclease subunit S [Bacillus cereus group sp. Bc015]
MRMESIEQKVSQMLIAQEEQFFGISDKWEWVKLGEVCCITMGQSPKGEYTTDDSSFIPLIGGPADMGLVYPEAKRYTSKPTKISKKGDLIVSVRATLGKTNMADGEYCLGRGVAAISSSIIDVELLRFYFEIVKDYLYTVSTGTTFQQISKKHLEELPFPLSNKYEQKRILNKISRLLNKMEEAKQLIEEAKETFELRRAAILDKAFRGELSQKWRDENNQNSSSNDVKMKNNKGHYQVPSRWEWVKLGDVCSLFSGKGFKKSEYTDSGVKLMKIQNVSYRKVIWDDVSYLPIDYLQKEAKLVLEKDDILIALNRPITNNKLKVAMINEEDVPSILYQRVGCLRPNTEVNKKYIYLLFTSSYFCNQIQERLIGSDQPYINLPPLKDILIPLPPLAEQEYIVEVVSEILDSNERCDKLIQDIDQLEVIKQSILSKAFRGELGTNDPSEENAIELLKEILQEQLK